VFAGDRHLVTALARSNNSQHLSAGYHNGAVSVFDVTTGECVVTFSGHRSQVSSLNFDTAGMQLVSGGLVSFTFRIKNMHVSIRIIYLYNIIQIYIQICTIVLVASP